MSARCVQHAWRLIWVETTHAGQQEKHLSCSCGARKIEREKMTAIWEPAT